MEKSTAGNKKHIQRLLILILTTTLYMQLPFSLCAQEKTFDPQSTGIIAMQQYCFTDTDCQFNLAIPDVMPQDVQSYVEGMPDSVSLVSSRKEDLSISVAGKKGTLIQLWFRFKTPGLFQLQPLTARILGHVYQFAFDPVTVYENPNTVSPEVFVLFNNKNFQEQGTHLYSQAGEHIRFTVYIRYAVQIVDFTWSVPQNSIFTEVKSYDITAGVPRGSGFSPEALPVAVFDWQPLVRGDWKFPAILITATAYNGARVTIPFPNYLVTILPNEQIVSDPVQNEESAFAYAFTDTSPAASKSKVSDYTRQDSEALRTLRVKERHSFPFSKAGRERMALEQKENITDNEDEPSVPLFWLLLGLSGIALVCSIVFFVIKKTREGSISIVILFVVLSGTVISGMFLSKQYALFVGGSVSSIPEDETHSIIMIQAGSRVQIKRSAGDWVYIKYDETYGWVRSDTLYVIQ